METIVEKKCRNDLNDRKVQLEYSSYEPSASRRKQRAAVVVCTT